MRGDAFSDGIFTRKKLAHKSFVHDHDFRSVNGVSIGETASVDDGHAQGFKVVRRDRVGLRDFALRFRQGTFLDIDGERDFAAAEWNPPCDRRRRNARQLLYALHQLADELSRLLRLSVTGIGQGETRRHHALGIESRRNLTQPEKTST